MQYLGNYTEDASVTFKFHTTDATGQPFTLAGTPAVAVYVEGSTNESTAGVTLTVDYDSRTGLHNVTIDLSADAFYAINKDYQVVLTAGTVDGVNVFPAVLACFSIEKRFDEVDLVAVNGDPQTNDLDAVYNLVNSCTGVVNDIYADTGNLLSRLTSARAGYLDNLNVGGAVAAQSDITALNQSASRRVTLTTVGQYERPESGSTVYLVEARTYDGDGAPVDDDSSPTLAVTGQTSGDLSANLGTVTNPATGIYRATYTVANDATLEPIWFDFATIIGGTTFTMRIFTQVCDFVAATFTTTDRANLEAALADTNELQTDWADGGRLDALIDAILADTTSLNDTALPEITSESDIPAEPSIRQGIMLLYMLARNNTQATATLRKLLNNAGNTVVQATMSDNGTTFNQGKLANP